MPRVLRLIAREYKMMVRTKGFIIGLIIVPVVMCGSMIAVRLIGERTDTTDQRVAVIDYSGVVGKKLIELAPSHSSGYYELSRLYLRNKDKFSDALPLAEKALQLDKRPENYFLVGWARDVNGDRMGALIAMEQAVKLAPENKKYQQLYTHLKNR